MQTTTTIRFPCPSCGIRLKAKRGATNPCPNCGEMIVARVHLPPDRRQPSLAEQVMREPWRLILGCVGVMIAVAMFMFTSSFIQEDYGRSREMIEDLDVEIEKAKREQERQLEIQREQLRRLEQLSR